MATSRFSRLVDHIRHMREDSVRRSDPVPPSADVFPKDLVDARVMSEIGHLELLSRSVVDGFLSGRHRSTHKGGCCEFSQHRPYTPGDEIRLIDWQIYARNDRYYVRQFEEETNLQALLVLDASGSMRFGMSTDSKFDFARSACACLARLLLHQRDAAGLAVLNGSSSAFVPPRQQAKHLMPILLELQRARATGDDELPARIRSCVPRLRRRGLFILFSDCFGDLESLIQSLRYVRARGHDVLVFHILAPEELHFEFRRWSCFQSLERISERINLDPATIRSEYLNRIGRFLTELEDAVTGLGGDYVQMTTDQDLGRLLSEYLRRRMSNGQACRPVAALEDSPE